MSDFEGSEDPDELNRVVFVKAHFQEEWVEKTVIVPTEKRIELFGKFSIPYQFKREKRDIKVATSDCEIDAKKLTEDVRAATLALNEQGYKIVSVTPVTSGQFSPRFDKKSRSRSVFRNAMRQIGYGFSYTEGVVIVAELITTDLDLS